MNSKTFLTLHSIIYAFFGIVLFVMPDVLWPMYGLEINDTYARFLSQHNSIFLGGLAALGYLLRDLEEGSIALQKTLTGFMIVNGLGFLITMYAALSSIFTGFGWSDPAFFALLTLLCFLQNRRQL